MINQRFYYQETGKILQLGSPVVVMQLLRMLTTVIVTVMVARLGTQALAASAIGYTTFIIFNIIRQWSIYGCWYEHWSPFWRQGV